MSAPLSLLPKIKGVKYAYYPHAEGYAVGTDGSVWSCRKWGGGARRLITQWRRLKPNPMKDGHLQVTLYFGGADRRRSVFVHRLVLETFVGPCPAGMEACHFPDASPRNNKLSNLRWDTRLANWADDHDRRVALTPKGEDSRLAKLCNTDVVAIRDAYAKGNITQQELAIVYGMHKGTINQIIRRHVWQHV